MHQLQQLAGASTQERVKSWGEGKEGESKEGGESKEEGESKEGDESTEGDTKDDEALSGSVRYCDLLMLLFDVYTGQVQYHTHYTLHTVLTIHYTLYSLYSYCTPDRPSLGRRSSPHSSTTPT
jgi:hypothetical protein